jgi:hypothetical protein
MSRTHDNSKIITETSEFRTYLKQAEYRLILTKRLQYIH